MEQVRFLDQGEIEHIHKDMIGKYGGKSGIRDVALLQSAIAQPRHSFMGEYVHQSLYEQAAAYFFHLCQNHPFVDGNKRVGLVATLVFLKLNAESITYDPVALEKLTWDVASGKADKKHIAHFLTKNLSFGF